MVRMTKEESAEHTKMHLDNAAKFGSREYRESHAVQIAEYNKKNKEKIAIRSKKYRDENKDVIYERRDRVGCAKAKKRWYQKNKEKLQMKAKEKYYANKKPISETERAYNRKYFKNKYQNDIQYNIRTRMCNRFNIAIRKYSNEDKITISKNKNIDYKAIIGHLSPFPEDMENWEIDHIIPLDYFDLTDKEQLKKAWSCVNIQWLKCEINGSKGSIIDFSKYPEQEKVAIELDLKL